ncbi:MAG: preprotein translocase subunit SecY [Endomicrobium sp.]|jgi:preprotein translocase subunit SecY|nr:preprotein translocase subunit SecY [Endomicrobium sp.]
MLSTYTYDCLKRLFFTIGILIVYRIGVSIPIPGINVNIIHQFFHMHTNHNGFLNFLDIFSGGALNRMSIFSIGVVPYINSSIVINLIQGAHIMPYLDKLSTEGEHGRKRLNQITRYLTLLLGIVQSIFLLIAIKRIPTPLGTLLITNPSISWHVLVIITLVTGSMFVMWSGEQITEYGICNGISLIILIGIIERFPNSFYAIVRLITQKTYSSLLLLVSIVVIMFISVIYIETAQRKIPIHYTKKFIEYEPYNDQRSFLPIRIDQSGVMAIVFTISILSIPLTIAQLFPKISVCGHLISQPIINFNIKTNAYYNIVYTCLVIFFCYFYNSISFNPSDIAQYMKKCGGFIPGIRSGASTRCYIKHIIDRLTLVGAIFVSFISLGPNYLKKFFHLPYLFSGTALLITISVTLDIIARFESYFIMRNYENFITNSENIMKGKGIKKQDNKFIINYNKNQ